jgi:5'-nucleotidase / UDP-sugar diphosphatase
MFLKNKKVVSLFLSLALVFSIFVGTMPKAAFAEEAKTLTILHVNDVHGRVEYQDAESREPSIGYPKLKTKVDEWKVANPNTLLLNAGDTVHGTVDINLSEGQAMVELMNMVGFDAMVPGNHDFNYGYKRLLELKEMADFPIIAANLEKEDGTVDFDGYVIKEMDGLNVGIFGIATEETKYKSHPDNTKGIEFADYIETSKEMVEKLEDEEVDVIVALVHVGIDGESDVTSVDIANAVDGIDVIVDGHSHSELPEGMMVNDTLIAQAGSYVKNIGVVELKFEDGKITDKNASFFTVEDAADVEVDKLVQAKINLIMMKNDVIKKQVIGHTAVDLVGERGVVRTGESTLGNLITDAMLEAAGADVALTNGGGIRASIAKGDITLGDAMTAFPFTNFLSNIEVTGADIMEALEHGVDSYPDAAGKFPHVAGMTYVFDPAKAAGERVTKVMIAGEGLELDKKYELVTNDFVAIGGDGYTMFDGKKIVAEGALLSDVLVEYLKEEGEVAPAIEGRIIASEDGEEVEETPDETKELEKTPEEPEETPEEPEKTEEVEEPSEKYVVKVGDVLWKIAREFNTTWEKLADYNNLENPHLIFPDQIIMIK